MATIEGLPEMLAAADLAAGRACLEIDETLYPLEAVYGAAYVFIDRCYVLLDRPQPSRYRVTLAPKTGNADAETLRALVGEFGNELLACAWRHRITQENRPLVEAVTMQAIAGAMGPPSLDDLAAFDFTQEPFEDPLGIAMSWEDKYKKGGKPPSEGDKQG
jgi:His-Xaa-Ser system protein HxsD